MGKCFIAPKTFHLNALPNSRKMATNLYRFGDGMKANICDRGWGAQSSSFAAKDLARLHNPDKDGLSRFAATTVSNVHYQVTHRLVDSIDSCAALFESDHCGRTPIVVCRAGIETAGFEKGMYALLSTSAHGLYYFADELRPRTSFPLRPLITAAMYLGFLAAWAFNTLCTYIGLPYGWSEKLKEDLRINFNRALLIS
jgi:hypothetical protein